MKRIISFILPLLVSCGGCSVTTMPLQNVDNAVIAGYASRPLSLEDVDAALARAARFRGWTIEEIGPGHAIGTLVVRGKHRLTIDITYTTEEISMRYKDSANLDYVKRNGVEYIHFKYNTWTSNLLLSLRRELGQL